ncbi:inositol monophosphatase family protein [Sphingosinicella sp. CPCC 101087]|uniref:inositol monophosphatase family protein n=1 Tax=Sphingosinicella sp. CPCC 101087 TaxID=2497754 RepID=UPI00101BEADA|nr:inositol monophosphatase family protein [Sphingosinicella sp. CPCC 101087]
MALPDGVSALMHDVAANVLVPRYRRLAQGDIAEKSPGEIVTSVDLAAERRLGAGLAALLPQARIVGEEATAADPQLLDAVGRGLVWLVDPLDGTANYANGRGPFGVMVALVENGVPQMGWILDGLEGRMCFAQRGKGAWRGYQRIRCSPEARRRPIAALGTHFLSPAGRERVHAAAARHLDRVPVPMCAAASYARLVAGQDDIALFQRSLPWDHAAGALIVEEAGGRVTHWDRSDYRVGGQGSGILAAASPALWEQAAGILLGPAAGLAPAMARAA